MSGDLSHPYALCLTHDVDRPYKRVSQAVYHAARERSLSHLEALLPGRTPYWQFEAIATLEADLGVRSAFYVLNEPHLLRERPPGDWLDPDAWVQHLGRYDVTAPEMVETLRWLDARGWEIGLHGSFHSPEDPARLAHEKAVLERLLDHGIVGGRQHYLGLSIPETWEHHRAIGLSYDASLGSSTEYGFDHGYRPLRPFDDEFVVFPLTLMEVALESHDRFEDRWAVCERLLEEARRNGAVMTVLWHPRYFNRAEFSGFRRLYRGIVERALEDGAWVGPPARLYRELEG